MNILLFSSALIASGVGVTSHLALALTATYPIPIPTQAEPFTSTITACGTVSAFVVVGTPTGTFRPGVLTLYVPPQVQATSTTIVDTVLNATEVIILEPLKGECAEYPYPTEVLLSTSATAPTPSAAACPDDSCSGKVIKAAQNIIDIINKVTLLSQSLQSTAKRLGTPAVKRDTAAAQVPFLDIVKGFDNIALQLTITLPRITYSPILPPGCDTDTVVIALIQFVRVHQALLEILIGKSGLLEQLPARRDTIGDALVYKRTPKEAINPVESGRIGSLIAKALRAVEYGVDTLAITLIEKIPTRSECAKQQKEAIDATLKETMQEYESNDG